MAATSVARRSGFRERKKKKEEEEINGKSGLLIKGLDECFDSPRSYLPQSWMMTRPHRAERKKRGGGGGKGSSKNDTTG